MRPTVWTIFLGIIVFLCSSAANPMFALAQKPSAEKPKLRKVSLKTKDGVNLNAFYFPSEKGKEAIPVLIIHEWGGQASPYGPLVAALNSAGCAVLAPDYRGHGSSDTKVTDARGRERKLEPSQMNRGDVDAIIKLDIEACKRFLVDENNAEKLNLNALVVIGIREGCVVATTWAQADWAFPSLGGVKQGQDVKALVYVSPDRLLKGVSLDPLFADRNLINLPIMVSAGASSPQAEEADRMSKRIESTKRKLGRGKVTAFSKDLPKTPLSGSTYVQTVPTVIPAIVKFITQEVIVSADVNPWVKRL
jgi:pimeloyl-ACP methyl ester carboxylesterase